MPQIFATILLLVVLFTVHPLDVFGQINSHDVSNILNETDLKKVKNFLDQYKSVDPAFIHLTTEEHLLIQLIEKQLSHLETHNLPSQYRRTVGTLAVLNDDTELAIMVLKHPGVNPNRSIENGDTMGTLAVWNDHADIAFEVLKHPLFDPNWQTDKGNTMAILAAVKNFPAIVLAITKHPSFDPNIQANNGNTVGMVAAFHHMTDALLSIIHHPEFNPNLQNKNGDTIGSLVAFNGLSDSLVPLINHPHFDANVRNLKGETLAHLWVDNFKAETLEQKELKLKILLSLIEKGLFVSLKNKKNKTVLDLLLEHKEIDIYQHLQKLILSDAEDCLPQVPTPYQHLDLTAFAQKLNCGLCGSEEAALFKGMSDCECRLCMECNYKFLDYLIKNSSVAMAECPLCHKELVKSYLLSSVQTQLKSKEGGVEEVNIYKKLLNQFHIQKLQKIPNYQFCLTEDCIGGRVISAVESAWYDCPLCKRSSFLKGRFVKMNDSLNNESEKSAVKNLISLGQECPSSQSDLSPDHPDYMKGRYRPCYYCGKITERIDGCNSMKCPECKNKWHWNYGDHQHHPEYKGKPVHDFTKDRMKYESLQPAHF